MAAFALAAICLALALLVWPSEEGSSSSLDDWDD